jgi:hypothetical protein
MTHRVSSDLSFGVTLPFLGFGDLFPGLPTTFQLSDYWIQVEKVAFS